MLLNNNQIVNSQYKKKKKFNLLVNILNRKKTTLFVRSFVIFYFYKFINNLMLNGKKDCAFSIYNQLLHYYWTGLKLKIKENASIYKFNSVLKKGPFLILSKAIKISRMVIVIKKKRVGGRVQQVPLILNPVVHTVSSIRNLVIAARSRNEYTILLKLIAEINALLMADISSAVWKKKKALYLQAIANKFSIKYL